MQNIDIKDEISDIKCELQAIKEMQDDYVNLMLFLKDIRQSINDSYISETSSYSFEGLKKTIDLIESQIDSYHYSSFAVGDISFRTSEAYKRLQKQLSILQHF
jgi:hypothetical protein